MRCDRVVPPAAEDCKLAGKHSVRALGILRPDPEAAFLADPASNDLGGGDGDAFHAKVPLGEVQRDPSKQLGYNEYIVYDEAQVRMRYLLQCAYS